MPEVHALLSASSSKQWLNCPPSARLQENFPNESSVYAEEGTFAHSICEYKVKKYLHERVRRPQSEKFYTEELEQSTDAYYEFVVGVIEEMKRNGCEPLVLVEERVDYSHIAPSGFGTADMLIIGHDAEAQPDASEPTSTVSLDDITKIIVQKIKQNRSNNEKIGSILKTYGVAKVGDLPASKYEAFLTDLSAI